MREQIDLRDRDSARRIVFYDDDAKNVAYWADQGCTTLDPSPQRASLIAESEEFCQKLLETCQRESARWPV